MKEFVEFWDWKNQERAPVLLIHPDVELGEKNQGRAAANAGNLRKLWIFRDISMKIQLRFNGS